MQLYNFLDEYINYLKIVSKVNKRTHYVICNNQEELCDEEQNKIEKAKELETPILSEIEFITTYGEEDYFEDFVCEDTWSCFQAIEPDSLIYEAFSFEDFCKYYKVDDTITEAIFEQKKESDDRIQVHCQRKHLSETCEKLKCITLMKKELLEIPIIT